MKKGPYNPPMIPKTIDPVPKNIRFPPSIYYSLVPNLRIEEAQTISFPCYIEVRRPRVKFANAHDTNTLQMTSKDQNVFGFDIS